MAKVIHDLIQGSDAWLQFRATHFGSSEAAAMLGLSKLTTRTELLRLKKTGVSKEFSDYVQVNVLDYGHEVEALARPHVESIIGADLYAVTCSDGELSASCDGLTMDDETAFEHKQWNEIIAAIVRGGNVPEEHLPQCMQILMVTGASKLVFVVSDGTPEKMVWVKVFPDPVWFDRIRAGWKQFAADLATYTPVEAAPVATATPTLGLPAVSIQVNGSIALIDNLDVFGAALTAYIAGMNLKPETDQHFADLEGAVKTFKKAEDALEAAENGALAQTASIDTMRRTVAQYKDLARVNRLLADKLVKTEKENRRVTIVTKARTAFDTHLAGLNASLGKPYMPAIASDFAGVVKGLKTITSIQNAVDTELARVKIEANAAADKIRINLGTLRELASAHAFLFADTAQIVLKAPDDCAALVKTRVAEHQAAELAKEEATRERIRAEEQQKAEAAVLEAERLRVEKESALVTKTVAVDAAPQVQPFVAANVVPITRTAPAPQAAPSTPPTLKLGEIGQRLGFSLTGDFLETLGFEPAARDKSALLFHEADFALICMRLVAHIQHVQAQRAA